MAGDGGAVSFYDSSPLLVDCAFSENTNSNGWGSAFSSWGGAPVLLGCVFAMNSGFADCGAVASHFSAPRLTKCTLVRNRAGAVFAGLGSNPVLERTVIAFGADGQAVWCHSASSAVSLTCCDIYGNAGGDWVGCIADQYGVDGNFSEDPLFCDPENGDFRIECSSPCAPGHHPAGADCGLIGALEVGCGGSSTESTTWGGVKALYR